MLLIGEPAAKKSDPRNTVDGQFSGPFVVASALLTGTMGWDSYRHLQDPAVRALMPKITCVNDNDVQAEFPANMAGKLTIRAAGQTHTRMVKVPKGEPGNFLTEAELRAKFHGLADTILGAEEAARLGDAILSIDTHPGRHHPLAPRGTTGARHPTGRGVDELRERARPPHRHCEEGAKRPTRQSRACPERSEGATRTGPSCFASPRTRNL